MIKKMKLKDVTESFLSMIIITLIFFAFAFLPSCTLSFQNISTHGTATDLVDQTQSAEPDVNANLTIPAKVL